jgi:hypothetical protein
MGASFDKKLIYWDGTQSSSAIDVLVLKIGHGWEIPSNVIIVILK